MRKSVLKRGRFSTRDSKPRKGETIEILAGLPDGARVERIVSRGEASPPGFWHDQDDDEWVMLAAGTATVVFEDHRARLRSGDWLLIPAHCRHRVASTSKDAVWLAVFLPRRTRGVARDMREKSREFCSWRKRAYRR
jgi:cupin 2 domain-containing protein